MARPEFADHWALKWSDLLRNEEKLLDAQGVQVFHKWIRECFAENVPLDQFVRELVTAQGSTYESPAANFYRALRDPLTRGETTARLFLGVRLECAKCHNHPFDHWTQDDYYAWASVFARIDYEIIENNRKDRFDQQEFVGEQRVLHRDEGKVTNARTGRAEPPRFLAHERARPESGRDPLDAMARWLTAPSNRAFAQAQANRIWYQLMGRGLVDPVDDFRVTNPASHPELLKLLARELVESGYDMRHVIREIMLSATYQSGTLADDQDALMTDNFAGVAPRRLSAEQLLDAQCRLLGTEPEFNGYARGVRAGQLAGIQRVRWREKSPSDDDRFLVVFGKPQRLMSCECERSDDTTLSQAFNLINGSALQRRLQDRQNCFSQWIDAGWDNGRVIDELFWAALSRPPTPIELQTALHHLDATDSRREALVDLAWALVNAKEFLFRQ